MPVLGVLLLVVQLAFAIHVVRTGRDRYWIMIVMMVPAIGCLVYFLTQVLPDIGQSPTVRRAGNSLVKAVDPERELRRRKDELAVADSVQNRLNLADECMEVKFFAEAASLYRDSLDGVHADDPNIMLKLANAYFADDRPAQAKQTLDRLIAANPGYTSTDGHLLYARCLEGVSQLDAADAEYDALLQTYPGEEARVRYALLLSRLGKTERANALFEETLTRGRRAPKYYRRREQAWIRIAEQNRTG